MTSQPPPSEPAVTVVEISDPTAASSGIELIDQDVVQLRSAPLRARRVIVRLHTAAVVFHSTNLRVRTRTQVRPGLLAYATFGPRTTGTVNGLPVQPDLMVAAAPESEVRFVSEPGWETVAFFLPPDEFAGHLAARQREGEFRLPQGVDLMRVDADRARALFDWGKRLVDLAAREPSLFDHRPKEQMSAHVEMLEALLATLDGAGRLQPDRSDRTRQAHSVIVKNAEDYALAHAGENIYVSDLCRATGVCERTLEYSFREVLGLTPVHYLTRLRLHRVREELLAASHASTTVSKAALDWGFWHFGEFSRAYKDCFGELPSDTLRRRAG